MSDAVSKDERDVFREMLREIWIAAGGPAEALSRVATTGSGDLRSVFAISDLAAASIAAAGLAISELTAKLTGGRPAVEIDRRLCSFWFGTSLRPHGWSPPPPWDPIAGDYETSDGWIRLHTNAPHHRAAALAILGVEGDREAVERAVSAWSAESLEAEMVAKGGCAAKMRSLEEWRALHQGRAVAAEPLLTLNSPDAAPPPRFQCDRSRPLAGLKVLDLTRVLAGPVATRFLAGYGATVLRIDPPDWDEPSVAPEMLLGKWTARLDLRDKEQHAQLLGLMKQADIMVHGYRADALERLGLGTTFRQQVCPGLVDVSLDAYGWSGPWRNRRGFDSLVQMSSGIAQSGMRLLGRDRPAPLPVQALDHATGYIMAAAAVLGILRRIETGRGTQARTSLARTSMFLAGFPIAATDDPFAPELAADADDAVENTAWGPAWRLKRPVLVEGAPMRWSRGARPIGADPPNWPS